MLLCKMLRSGCIPRFCSCPEYFRFVASVAPLNEAVLNPFAQTGEAIPSAWAASLLRPSYSCGPSIVVGYTRAIALLRVSGDTSKRSASSLRATPPVASVKADLICSDDNLGGRPIGLPRSRAAAIPARVRSPMRERSNSASAPMTWKRRRPLAVRVSIASDNETKLTPRCSSSCVIVIR